MKYIISGTNRKGSRSRIISNLVQKLYQDEGEKVEIIDLSELPLNELMMAPYGGDLGYVWSDLVAKINQASGIIFVVPEYNGSMPGALKAFIDHWKYPHSFEFRPVCYIGLGGLFGGLRPVEHLQQIMGYRNAFQYPERIFLTNIFKNLQDGQIQDPIANQLLKSQVQGFRRFVTALESAQLDANSKLKLKPN